MSTASSFFTRLLLEKRGLRVRAGTRAGKVLFTIGDAPTARTDRFTQVKDSGSLLDNGGFDSDWLAQTLYFAHPRINAHSRVNRSSDSQNPTFPLPICFATSWSGSWERMRPAANF